MEAFKQVSYADMTTPLFSILIMLAAACEAKSVVQRTGIATYEVPVVAARPRTCVCLSARVPQRACLSLEVKAQAEDARGVE